LPPSLKNRLAVEAGATLGWWKYVGEQGGVVGLDAFGISAPGDVAMDYFGLTVGHVVAQARQVVKRNRQLVET